MPPQLSELETLLRQLVAEHRRLLAEVERHAAAMKTFDLPAMEDAGRQQEACRLRINAIEQRRRVLCQQMARAMNQPGELTLRLLAGMFPAKADALLKLRAELRDVAEQIAMRTRISGRVASAVLGHLNTVVRIVCGAVERAGVYTKKGIPSVSGRIGLMETVG
ncbi:MAG TPA: flagellar export chaperone FlgN [Tepidisphaeraceae bacterium]|jgi:hypothetical protein